MQVATQSQQIKRPGGSEMQASFIDVRIVSSGLIARTPITPQLTVDKFIESVCKQHALSRAHTRVIYKGERLDQMDFSKT